MLMNVLKTQMGVLRFVQTLMVATTAPVRLAMIWQKINTTVMVR